MANVKSTGLEFPVDSFFLLQALQLLNEALDIHVGGLYAVERVFGQDSLSAAKYYGIILSFSRRRNLIATF